MAAIALYFQTEIDVVFFAGLPAQKQALAFVALKATGVGVDAVFSVAQRVVLLDEPLDTIVVAAFFVGGKRQDHVAVRRPAFFLEPNKICDQDRVAIFYVRRAPAVKIAIHFIQLK